jgi:hypothetical protein
MKMKLAINGYFLYFISVSHQNLYELMKSVHTIDVETTLINPVDDGGVEGLHGVSSAHICS